MVSRSHSCATQDVPKSPSTPGLTLSPPTLPSAPDPAPKVGNPTTSEIKSLVDQIRKEVMESLHRELQIKAQVSATNNDRVPAIVVEERIEKLVGELAKAKAGALRGRVASELDRVRQNSSQDAKSVKLRVQATDDRHGLTLNWKTSGSDQQFEQRTRDLLATYDQNDETKKEKFVEQLTKLVAEHFEFKQSIRETELKQLESQLQKLQALHDQRTKEKNEIIQDRVRQLTREAAGLGWGSEKSGEDAATETREAIIIERCDDGMPQGNRSSKPGMDYCFIHRSAKPPVSWSCNFTFCLNGADSCSRPVL